VLTPQKEETVPTYQYACTDCGDRTEVVQRFTDDALSVCTACGGRLRKVFSPVGIVFKGSGFYRTDSRSGSTVPADGGSKDGGGSKEGSAKDGSASKNGSAKDGGSGSKSGGSESSSSSSSSNGSSDSGSGSGSSSGGSSSDKKAASSSGSKVA
jgi:putative FmdB family regulatory protein